MDGLRTKIQAGAAAVAAAYGTEGPANGHARGGDAPPTFHELQRLEMELSRCISDEMKSLPKLVETARTQTSTVTVLLQELSEIAVKKFTAMFSMQEKDTREWQERHRKHVAPLLEIDGTTPAARKRKAVDSLAEARTSLKKARRAFKFAKVEEESLTLAWSCIPAWALALVGAGSGSSPLTLLLMEGRDRS